MTPPLVTTFAGDSVRAEGMFVTNSSGVPQYIYASSGNIIYLISLSTFTVAGAVSASGTALATQWAMTPDENGTNVYCISNGSSNSNSYLATFPGNNPSATYSSVQIAPNENSIYSFAINNAGTLAYVLNTSNQVTSYNVPALTATGSTLSLSSFPGPQGQMYPDNVNQYVYLLNQSYAVLIRFNVGLTSYTTLSLAYVATSFVADSTNTYGYVGCGNGTIYQVNLSSFTLTGKSFEAPTYPVTSLLIDKTNSYMYGYAYYPTTSNYAYVAQWNLSATGTFISPTKSWNIGINTGWRNGNVNCGLTNAIVLDPNGLYIYTINNATSSVEQINIATSAITSCTLGGTLSTLAIGYVG